MALQKREGACETVVGLHESSNRDTRAMRIEPSNKPPVKEPEPDPEPIQDPEFPQDPGPAEDPETQPVKN